jgi:protoporphyrin/coproporphyrin ferrochelatase
MIRPDDHPVTRLGKVGVLIVNLGSPDAPTSSAVKRYLGEFLSDPRVVELNPILWKPILYGIILNTRPSKSAAAYSEVWSKEGAPLIVITKRQAEAMQVRLGERVIVDFAMRYGNPSIPQRLRALQDQGCDRILIAPLYPQYSGATTATVNDMVFATLKDLRWQPAIRTLPPYYDDPVHIRALKNDIEAGLAGLPFTPDAVMTSFHSMPERTLLDGDPYHCQCQKTARLLGEALDRDLIVSFQSRLGRAKWLGPATDETLESLPGKGIRKLAVVAPGFSADNLETLEEVAIRGRESFLEAGGTDFAYLPCLNDSAAGLDMLATLLSRELEGWIKPR